MEVMEILFIKFLMVGPNGLEPLTSSLSEKRSNHLSYDPVISIFRFYHNLSKNFRNIYFINFL